MPSEELLALGAAERNDLARFRLATILAQVIANSGGRVEVPPLGSVAFLAVNTRTDGSWDCDFGFIRFEDAEKHSSLSRAELEARLGVLEGQGILALYVEADFFYSEIMEVRYEHSRGQVS